MDDTFSSQDVPDHRIVAMTTVYLDEKAQRFYQRSGMDTELPPYAANKRRGHERAAPPRIWDNDNKRLYVYWYGSELKAIRMGFNFAMPGEDITESPRCKLRAKVGQYEKNLAIIAQGGKVKHAHPQHGHESL
mmetsp:Transcript_32885/g.86825  ORF Transcript_32885/g.86825 Transcript_32885/m.86825 type:complete len:133 (+) Transcript_32885:3-401(+)